MSTHTDTLYKEVKESGIEFSYIDSKLDSDYSVINEENVLELIESGSIKNEKYKPLL